MAWLKQHFVETLRVDDVAHRAHMSPSTFRQHFRALTGVSPLQYQKQLRLQEARQLMLNEKLDAGSAAVRVGYESPSQFSREYSRLFGAPPLRDVRSGGSLNVPRALSGTGYGRAVVGAGGWKPVSSARRVSVSTSWNRWPPMIQVGYCLMPAAAHAEAWREP